METLQILEHNKRLDQVVFAYYGDLTMFDRVLAANPHLTNVTLSMGDSVNLPKKEITTVEESLW